MDCALSKKHIVSDVIKHVLTLYRKDKKLKEEVSFECPDTEPAGFELRQVDDDSDCSSDHSGPMIFYKPHPDFGALDGNQPIGGFESFVLVQKKNWKTKIPADLNKREIFIEEIQEAEGIVDTLLKM